MRRNLCLNIDEIVTLLYAGIIMFKRLKSPYRDIAEIAIAFAVAWLFYQGLVFATGTPLPIVSVVSDSMFHATTFDEWWNNNKGFYEQKNITKEKFASFQFSNGLSKGDLLFVLNAEPQVGDMIIYQSGRSSFTKLLISKQGQ